MPVFVCLYSPWYLGLTNDYELPPALYSASLIAACHLKLSEVSNCDFVAEGPGSNHQIKKSQINEHGLLAEISKFNTCRFLFAKIGGYLSNLGKGVQKN